MLEKLYFDGDIDFCAQPAHPVYWKWYRMIQDISLQNATVHHALKHLFMMTFWKSLKKS